MHCAIRPTGQSLAQANHPYLQPREFHTAGLKDPNWQRYTLRIRCAFGTASAFLLHTNTIERAIAFAVHYTGSKPALPNPTLHFSTQRTSPCIAPGCLAVWPRCQAAEQIGRHGWLIARGALAYGQRRMELGADPICQINFAGECAGMDQRMGKPAGGTSIGHDWCSGAPVPIPWCCWYAVSCSLALRRKSKAGGYVPSGCAGTAAQPRPKDICSSRGACSVIDDVP